MVPLIKIKKGASTRPPVGTKQESSTFLEHWVRPTEGLLWVRLGKSQTEHIESASPPKSGHEADMPGRPLGARRRR